MADSSQATVLEHPRIHLMHMTVFALAVAVVVAVLFRGIRNAFMANVGLNALIIGTLIGGVIYAFYKVWQLVPEINWVNGFRAGLTNTENPAKPVMLAPMAAMLGEQEERAMLSTNTLRSLLDSLASRLDESRDLMRYLVGLLIFLGLLGTFWGLLTTVSSIGDAISALDVTAGQSGSMFQELKNGLQRPLGGMGLSFASSLFGLAGSLILGFYDLKLSRAQNRFYHNLEDWLSTITDVSAGEAMQAASPQVARLDVQSLQRGIDRLGHLIEQRGTGGGASAASGKSDSLEELADAVASLVQQMREEQKTMRQWAQSQQVQQNEMQRLLIRATGGSARSRVRGEE